MKNRKKIKSICNTPLSGNIKKKKNNKNQNKIKNIKSNKLRRVKHESK